MPRVWRLDVPCVSLRALCFLRFLRLRFVGVPIVLLLFSSLLQPALHHLPPPRLFSDRLSNFYVRVRVVCDRLPGFVVCVSV